MYNTSGMRRRGIALVTAGVLSCLVFAQAARAAEYQVPGLSGATSGVTASTAVLAGVVDTTLLNGVIARGSAVTWYFEVGQNSGYTSRTPAKTISAWQQTIPVSWTLIGLQPLTFYHYRLVVTAQGNVAYGQDKDFITAPTGFVFLRGAQLRVIHRRVSVPLSCASKRRCTGHFTITAARGGQSVVCDSSPFRLKPGRHLSFKVKIDAACRSLIKHSRRHRIKAKVTLMPSSSQLGIVDRIELKL